MLSKALRRQRVSLNRICNQLLSGLPFIPAVLMCGLLLLLVPPALSAATSAPTINFATAAHAYRSADFDRAITSFTALASNGDINAQYLLGLIYRDGKGVSSDQAQSKYWLEQAAHAGHAPAQAALGSILLDESALERDLQAGFSWLSNAAKQGDAGAQLAVAQAYEKGRGTPVNIAGAVHWYRQAAASGLTQAQRQLAVLYLTGAAMMPRNQTLAIRWLNRAAKRGDRVAQRRLGVVFEQGDGVKANLHEAIKWHRRAAAQGSAWAQYHLAIFYEEGRGVRRSAVQALSWFLLADQQASVKQGPWRTGEIIKRLKQRMSRHQVRRARGLVANWRQIDERPANQASLALSNIAAKSP